MYFPDNSINTFLTRNEYEIYVQHINEKVLNINLNNDKDNEIIEAFANNQPNKTIEITIKELKGSKVLEEKTT